MCAVSEHSNSMLYTDANLKIAADDTTGLSERDTHDLTASLLEFAANDDLAGFKKAVESRAKVDVVGSWYGRRIGSNHMALEQRTAAMVASVYGSVNVLKYILDYYTTYGGDINRSCGSDGSTALHCAAAGGSSRIVETVNILVSFGADVNALDARGLRPADVIMATPNYPCVKSLLESILKKTTSANGSLPVKAPPQVSKLGEYDAARLSDSVFETVDEYRGFLLDSGNGGADMLNTTSVPSSMCSSPDTWPSSSSSSSPKTADSNVANALKEGVEKNREYPVDPPLTDIKNSIYATDEFRMFSFKVRPCSRAYSHDWTECPFAHPGENARRRDPRRYHYRSVPCPDFRKGSCRRGDACEYAHGVFECWLHPSQYRTRLCKDGTSCTRRVCFFAHTTEELRPLYFSAGSAVVCPRTSSLDMTLSPVLAQASPVSVLMMPSFSPSSPGQNGLSTPQMSPSSTSANSLGGTWHQPNVPTPYLPGISIHASRLRSALSARDLPLEDLSEPANLVEGQLMDDFASTTTLALSTHTQLNAAVAASGCGGSCRTGKYRNSGFSISPTNLEELFASEMMLSPRNAMHESALFSQIGTQLQSHKSTQVHSQLQNILQLQSNGVLHSSQLGISLDSLSHISSSVGLDLNLQSDSGIPSSAAAVAASAALTQQDKCKCSSRDLGADLVWSDWGSPTGKPEWGIKKDDLFKFRKSASFGFKESEGPDFSWAQRLVKDGPLDNDSCTADCPAESIVNINEPRDIVDHSVLGSWIGQMHLDQIVT